MNFSSAFRSNGVILPTSIRSCDKDIEHVFIAGAGTLLREALSSLLAVSITGRRQQRFKYPFGFHVTLRP